MTVDVRVLALGSAANMPERFVSTKEGFEELSFSNRTASRILKAYSAETLPIYAKATDSQDGSEFGIAEEVKLPENSESVLLLCWGSKEAGLRYLAVNDSILDADYNNWLMVNTTAKTLGFRIGQNKKPVFLEPQKIENYKLTAEKGKGVPVVGRTRINGEIKTFYSTYWTIRENERSIVIFIEVGDKIKVRKIGDRLMKSQATHQIQDE